MLSRLAAVHAGQSRIGDQQIDQRHVFHDQQLPPNARLAHYICNAFSCF
jgi:hypothetical protein